LLDKASWVTLNLLKSMAIIVWSSFGFRLSEMLRRFLREMGEKSPVPDRTLPLLNNLAKVIVAALAIYFFMVAWNIDATAWIASAGIIGIALGFAAKDTLANLFAGVFILVDAPYKVGDFVILGAGERGEVTQIGIRSTRLLTRDDIEITIPNAVIGNGKIVNESGGPHEKERIRVKLGVAYGTDVDKLREVLLDIANNHPDVCKDPSPRVRFRTFGESSLDFELLAWVEQPVLSGRVTDALNTSIYKRLGAEGIEIPFPIRDVRIHK
jgi:MscS family membrane protein